LSAQSNPSSYYDGTPVKGKSALSLKRRYLKAYCAVVTIDCYGYFFVDRHLSVVYRKLREFLEPMLVEQDMRDGLKEFFSEEHTDQEFVEEAMEILSNDVQMYGPEEAAL